MTIVASVKVRDGIVLATDSMAQISVRTDSGQKAVAKTYCNAKKLFHIQELPIGVMTFGLGNIGNRSIESLTVEFSRDLQKHVAAPFTLEAISGGLLKFVSAIYTETFKAISLEQRQKELRLGFFIGGYSPGKFLAEEWEFELPASDKSKLVRPEEAVGASWRGIILPFARMHNGYDPRIPVVLKQKGVSGAIVDQIFSSGKWGMPVAYDGMPLQDAINFAKHIVETTIGAATFELGATTCGYPIQIAVVLPDEGWKWIQKPELRA